MWGSYPLTADARSGWRRPERGVMPVLKPVTVEMTTSLMLDALYYHAATEALDRAKRHLPRIERARKRTEALQNRFESLRRSPSKYDRLEAIAVQLEGAEDQLGLAYGPMLQSLATVHVLAVACLEAHVNWWARERLVGKVYESFEWLGLEAKWLFLPKLTGSGAFDPGKEPFQGFASMIKWRNALTHYKGRQETWTPPGVPSFLEHLGLTVDAGAASLAAARGMIETLCSMMGERKPPYWLTTSAPAYFPVTVETR